MRQKQRYGALVNRRAFIAGASLAFALCFSGCLRAAAPLPNNVFDDMLDCDVHAFAKAVGGEYHSEKFVFDDGFTITRGEGGTRVKYGFSRDFDDDLVPHVLTLTRRAYVAVSEDEAVVAWRSEVYLRESSLLRLFELNYRESNMADRNDPVSVDRGSLRNITAEEAESKLNGVGADTAFELFGGNPSECFAGLFLQHMDSSFSYDDWGMLDDIRDAK